MKKLAILVALAVVLCLFGMSQAQAAPTDALSVTVTLQSLSVSIAVGTEPWAIGAVVAESEHESGLYTVENDGNVIEDIAIVCDASLSDWSVAAAIDVDVFKMEAKGGDFSDTYTTIHASDTLKADLAVDGLVEDLKLKFTAPKAGSNTDEQSISVTLTASASS